MINYEIIPKSIMDKSISLKEFGILEVAWNVDDVKSIIYMFEKKEIAILGGDVYKIIDGKVCKTYDSWYINKSNEDDFCHKSHETALSYILSYEERNDGKFVYAIVF